MFTAILSEANGTLITIPDSQLMELVQRGEATFLVHTARWCPSLLASCEGLSSPQS